MEKREWKKENGKKRMENVDENDIKRKCVTSKEMNLENERFPIKYKANYLNEFFVGVDKDIVPTEAVIRTLMELDEMNILFVGENGCGKSTLLNIMIREYYELKVGDSFPENNILYINNLKEQGISFFRNEMRSYSQSRSTILGKKKMIIIDDIDCINEQSQQVFRNHIDRYKDSTHFISVCTNIHKVIESFQSRVHIIKIEQPTKFQLLTMYNKIVDQEKFVITDDATHFLLKYCKRSFRDLLNQLEKIYILQCPINKEICMKLCSELNSQIFEEYFHLIRNNLLHSAIQLIYKIYDTGYSVVDIYDYLFSFVKSTNILMENEKYLLIPLFCSYITIFHRVHEDPIELAIFTNRVYIVLQK